MESKKNETHRNRDQIGSCQRQGLRVGEMGEGGQKVQTPSYKISKFWGFNVKHDDYS